MSEVRIPTGKIRRVLSGGRTAAKVGGQVIGYYAKRPFLSEDRRGHAFDKMTREGGQALFSGLGLLKGTALKMAQLLSLESDLLPQAVCQELAKAYHQVPPINRALARKVVADALGAMPETLFKQFDDRAFAAASLGQVHRAMDADGSPLAVKIQYPGIAATINSDMRMLRQLLVPFVDAGQLQLVLDEVAARLAEEVDYLQEADNLSFFSENLAMDRVRIPSLRTDTGARTVLTTSLMPGRPLDRWLQTNPGQKARDRVAQTLHDLMIRGLYELGVIHADPNPGNFIIADDLTVGLVDFGCVKRLDVNFVDDYRHIARAAARHDKRAHMAAIERIGMVSDDVDEKVLETLARIVDETGDWISRLFVDEIFDFGAHPGFIAQGQKAMGKYHQLHRHLKVNPDFIFVDRTRYGLLRIFEMLGARVRLRTDYEW